MRYITILVGLFILLHSSSCSQNSTNPNGPQQVIRENGKVFIVDRTGKRWDVTHAENKYGLKADQFQFGLGPNAIRPILNPKFSQPGDPAYPGPNDGFLIIGTIINGDKRAYPISVLTRHEIADEKFDSTYVAVAY